MKNRAFRKTTVIVILFVFVLTLAVFGSALSSAATALEVDAGDRFADAPVLIIEAGERVADLSDRGQAQRYSENYLLTAPQTAVINVTYLGSWPAPAQTAFQYAVDIWETLITSPVPIEVEAEFRDLGNPDILGSAGSNGVLRNFSGVPEPDTWYSMALANKLAGSDLFPALHNINANFNSTNSFWYFGTVGNPGPLEYDFASVVLHELGHGLGFFGSMSYSGGVGSWGISNPPADPPDPVIYDTFTENGMGAPLINFPNDSIALGNQLTGGDIFFNGTSTNAANGGSPAELYAPGIWNPGSSYAHLDEGFNNTVNALMTYSLDRQEVRHHPGPVALAMFEDMGWMLDQSPTPSPTVTNTPGPSPTPTATPDFDEDRYLPMILRNFYPSGPLPGFWQGPIETLFVSPDQTMVVDFTSRFDFGTCGFHSVVHPDDFLITNDQFGGGTTFLVTGTFFSQTTVTGTLELDGHFVPICNAAYDAGPYVWTATWLDDSQPSVSIEGGTLQIAPASASRRESQRTE